MQLSLQNRRNGHSFCSHGQGEGAARQIVNRQGHGKVRGVKHWQKYAAGFMLC